jgi:ribosomal protein S17E
MGRVRTKTVKKSAKVIIERYYPKLTLDFETNKRICDEIAIIASKRLRNKVGYPTSPRSPNEVPMYESGSLTMNLRRSPATPPT